MKTPSKFLIPGLASSIAALLALALGTGNALAVDGTWILNGNANWSNNTTAWAGNVIADGVGATADLSFATLSNPNKTITMDSARTLGKVMLGASGRNLDIGIGSNILTLDDTFNAGTNPLGDNVVEITYRAGSGRNGSIGVPIELKNNLLISNPDNTGNTGILISGGLSSSNGNLTITNNSNLASRTKFNSTVSDGAPGNTITYSQTVGWTEFNNANTFTGTTTNVAGTMVLGNSLALQNSALNTTASGVGNNVANGNGLKTKVTTLTLGGLTGNKAFASLFNTVVDGNNLGYSAVTALTLNPGSGTVSYDGAIANGAAGMTLTKTGAGTQVLNGTNTYTGATAINVGTLKLDTSGALDAASSVSIAAGATFDLTAKTAASATYTWNATSLSASGAVTPATIIGTALGTIAMGVKPISLTTNGTNPSLTVTGAALSLGGNTFTVVVPGPALGVGVYTLVSASSITGTVNATASYTGGNGLAGGTTGVVSLSGGNTVILTVTGGSLETIVASPTALPASLITTYPTASASESVAVSGSNLIANITATAQTNFEVSDDNVTFGPTASYTQSGGNVSSTPLYVRLAANASAAGSYDNITAAILTSGSATPVNVTTAASGNSVAKASPTVTVTVGSYTYNASPQGPTAYTTSPTGDTGAPTWSYAGIFPTIYGASPALPTLPGTYSATVSLAADANFNAASSSTTAFSIAGGNITVTGSLTPFTTTVGTASTAQNVSVSGTSLTGNITATAPTGFEVSADGLSYAPTATYTQSGGNASGTLYVRLSAAATLGSYTDNVVLTSTATPSVSVPASGTVNPNPGDGYWILNGSDNWSNNTTAWLGNFIADGVGGTAHFTTNFSSNRTVTLDSNRTVGILNLSVTGRTLNLVSSGGAVLTLDNTGSSDAQINMTTSQNMVVTAPIALNDSVVVNNSVNIASGKDLALGDFSSTNGSLTIKHTSLATSTTRYNGIISNGSGTLAFTQTSGDTVFNAANSYTGVTTINGGSLKLGANDVLPNASDVSIGSATLNADIRTDSAGSLDVTGSSVINLGAGAALSFANSSAVSWTGGTLNVTGTLGATSLRFGTTSGGLTSSQLALVSVNGSGAGTYALDANGYLVLSGYTTWAATHAGSGLASADFDNDCVANGIEYFMNITTPGFTANPALNPSHTITWSNGGNIPPSAYGTQYVVQTSGNLADWTDVPVGNLTTNTAGPGGSLTYTLTGAAPRFVRLIVTPN